MAAIENQDDVAFAAKILERNRSAVGGDEGKVRGKRWRIGRLESWKVGGLSRGAGLLRLLALSPLYLFKERC
jgi:hypothetical protein